MGLSWSKPAFKDMSLAAQLFEVGTLGALYTAPNIILNSYLYHNFYDSSSYWKSALAGYGINSAELYLGGVSKAPIPMLVLPLERDVRDPDRPVVTKKRIFVESASTIMDRA